MNQDIKLKSEKQTSIFRSPFEIENYEIKTNSIDPDGYLEMDSNILK